MQAGENARTLISAGENVFTVNALMRALNQTEYEKMQVTIAELAKQLNEALRAIDEFGLYLYKAKDGKVFLSPNPFDENGDPYLTPEDEEV